MATLKKLIQSAPKMRGSLPIKAKKGTTIKKAQYGTREQEARLDTLYTKKDKVGNISTNRYVGRMPNGSLEMGKVTKTRNADGRVLTNKDATQSAILGRKYTDDDIRKSMNEKKNGGKITKAQAGIKVPVKRKVDYPGYRPPSIPSDSLPKNEGSIRNIKKLYDDGVFYGKKSEKPSKAKNGKWMQKAAASIKKRGTAGKCTPITKPGCTGKAKTLAKTFKAIAKKNKK